MTILHIYTEVKEITQFALNRSNMYQSRAGGGRCDANQENPTTLIRMVIPFLGGGGGVVSALKLFVTQLGAEAIEVPH